MAWQSTLPDDPIMAGWWRDAADREQQRLVDAGLDRARRLKVRRIVAGARLARLDAAQAEMAAHTAARRPLAANDYESAWHYLHDVRER